MNELNGWLPSSKTFVVMTAFLCLSACGSGNSTSSSSNGGGSTTNPNPGPNPLATATYAIQWDAVNDNNVTGYRIYYSTVPFSQGAAPGRIDVNGSSSASHDFRPGNYGITQGTTVYVVVSSIGSSGLESPISSVSSIVAE